MSDRLYIFDTTLRDGEQVPGCQLNTVEKIEVAKALQELGVDVIEAGFPISSPGDFEAVEAISKIVKNAAFFCSSDTIEAHDVSFHTRILNNDYWIKTKTMTFS